MARPGAEKNWTDTQRRHDWPLYKRKHNLPDGQGPTMPDWPTEKELADAERKARKGGKR